MILVGILDTKEIDFESLDLSVLPKEETERLHKMKNSEKKRDSFLSRLLLKKICEEYFQKELPKIEYSEKGKPFFVNENMAFSISHDKNFAVVAVTDENNAIGVDIQSFGEADEKKERIEKRFLTELDFKNSKCDFDFKKACFELKEKEIELKESSFSFYENPKAEIDAFLEKWTSLEACLKLVACGFEGFTNVNKYLQKTKIKSVFLQHGGTCYALSIAIQK